MRNVLILTIVAALVALYHNGVSAEQQCLTSGHSAQECAKLRM
jgi:hypothetical protein